MTSGAEVEKRPRWQPDDQLISAVRCGNGSRRMSDLQDADRSWVVAGLTLAGLTAEDIADRLSCSLRLVRSVRAADMTQVCVILQRESLHFSQELRLAQSELAQSLRDLAVVIQERDRIKGQLDRVIDARLVGAPVSVCNQGHVMTDWNVWIDRRGRRWCRECHATRQRDYRLSRKLGVSPARVREARRAGELDAFILRVSRMCTTASC